MKVKIDRFSGMNGLLDPTKLSENEPALLENFTLKSYGNVGSLVSRNGFTRYNTNQIAGGGSGVGSMFEVTLNGVDYMVANIINGSSSALYYEDSPYTGAWTAITGANGSAQAYKVNYASFRDKVYITNRGGGTLTNAVWDGTTAGFYDMGCPPPDPTGITFTQLVSGGYLSAGQYRYLFTYVYDNAQESYAMAYYSSNNLAPITSYSASANDANQINNIPVSSNSRVTARKIYRTKAGQINYYYCDTIYDNVTTTVKDGKADDALGDQIDLNSLLTPLNPPCAKYVAVHKERLVLGNIVDNLYNAIPSSDISLTESAGGSLDLLGTYKYRFYKGWLTNYGDLDQFAMILSEPLDKTITLTGANQSVSIDYTGTDNTFSFIVIQRTDGGGSDFKWLDFSLQVGLHISNFPYDEGAADGGSIQRITPVFSGDIQNSLPGNIKISDAGKPDLFSTVETAADGTLIPASNEWNIGEPITGIHSEENRIIIFSDKNIYQLDTTAQSKQFWRLDKIVSGIGADAGLQCQVGNGYVFIKSNLTGSSKLTVYEWDGRGVPRIASLSIQNYLEDNRVTSVKSIVYDQYNNRVLFTTTATASINTAVFVYNLDLRDDNGLGKWEIWLNAADLNLTIGLNTKSYGVLWGNGDGYVHHQSPSIYRDIIAGSGSTFTTKLRTKTFTTYDTDIRPEIFRADITATGAITPVLKTAVDGTLNSGDNMTALANGFNRPRQNSFTNAQDKGYRQVYFQLEMTANELQKVHGLYIDLKEENGIGR